MIVCLTHRRLRYYSTRMKPASGSAREGLLAATAPDVPVGMSPDVPLGMPPDIPVAMAIGQPHAPLAPEVMYREQVGFADGYSMQTLSAASGLVLRERVYLSQLCCAACEKKTSYAAGVLPENSSPEAYVDDNDMLSFLNPGAFEVREESECCCRYCCHQFRELKLGYFAPRVVGGQPGDGLWEGGLGGFGWPEGETPALLLERPFRCTVCCCCCLLNPQEMKVFDSGVSLGGALQEWDCCMVLWPYRRYARRRARREGNDRRGAAALRGRLPQLLRPELLQPSLLDADQAGGRRRRNRLARKPLSRVQLPRPVHGRRRKQQLRCALPPRCVAPLEGATALRAAPHRFQLLRAAREPKVRGGWRPCGARVAVRSARKRPEGEGSGQWSAS